MRDFVHVWLGMLALALVGAVGCAGQKKCVCVCPRPVEAGARARAVADGGLSEGERFIARLLQDKPFVAYKTKRIHLYYYKGSEAERDRDLIVKRREKALDRLERFFGKKPPRPIRVFLFPSAADAKPYRVGTASPALLAYYALYQKGHWAYEKHYPGHELTHLFSNTDKHWQTVHVVGLLDEGLAEHFAGFALDPHLRLTQHMQVAGKTHWNIRLHPRSIDYGKMGLYEYGGSFVKLLIDSQPRGRARFLALLRDTRRPDRDSRADFGKLSQALHATYGKSLATLTAEWNRVLAPYWTRRYVPRPADRKGLDALVKQRGFGAIERVFFFRFRWYLQLVLWLPNKRWGVVTTNAGDQWTMRRKPYRRR